MNRITRSHYGDPAAYRRDHHAISRPDRSKSESRLAPGAALMMIVLSSLGLWSVIWLVVSSLAAGLAQ